MLRSTVNHRARWWIALAYVVFAALVVPWYWPAGDSRYVLGFPIWALVTLSAVFATSVFTAWVYLWRSDDEND